MSNLKSITFFFLLMTSLSLFFYKDSITEFPSYIHAWSQSDRYALAIGFTKNGLDFFHPETFYLNPQFDGKRLLNNPTGITSVDFPIHEYLIAILMKIFHSNSPAIFRIYILLYGWIGLFFLFKLTSLLTESQMTGYFIAVFVFTAPVYTYYQDGFIPSIPSFANCLIGLYFYFKYLKHQSIRDFSFSLFFLTISALNRTPFAIFIVALALHQFLHYFKDKKAVMRKMLTISISLLAISTYYLYNNYLRKKYGSIFLGAFLPANNFHEMKDIINNAFNNWSTHYFTLTHYLFLLLIIFLAIFLKYKSRSELSVLQKSLFMYSAIVFCGTTTFFLLMARQFADHDYYFIDSYFTAVILFTVLLLSFLQPLFQKNKIGSTVVLFCFAVSFIIFSNNIQAQRRVTGVWDRQEITRKNFEGADVYLDSLGIPRTAKILVIDSYTPNIPLILMDRKGFSIITTSRENIISALTWNYDYAVIQNCFLLTDVIKNYPEIIHKLSVISNNGKITVYKKSSENSTGTLFQFLGLDKLEKAFSFSLFANSAIDSSRWSNINRTNSEFYYSPPVSGFFNATDDYGPALTLKASDFAGKNVNQLFFEGMFFSKDEYKNFNIVTSLESNGASVFYSSYNLKDYTSEKNQWVKMQCQFFPPPFKTKDDMLKVYLWNDGKNKLYFDDIIISVFL